MDINREFLQWLDEASRKIEMLGELQVERFLNTKFDYGRPSNDLKEMLAGELEGRGYIRNPQDTLKLHKVNFRG